MRYKVMGSGRVKAGMLVAFILTLTCCSRPTSPPDERQDSRIKGSYVLTSIDGQDIPENRYGWVQLDFDRGCLVGNDGVNGFDASYRAYANHIELGRIASKLALAKLLPPGTSSEKAAAYQRLSANHVGERLIDRLSTAKSYTLMDAGIILRDGEGRTLVLKRITSRKQLEGRCPA